MWVDLTRGGPHRQRRSAVSLPVVEARPTEATGRPVCPRLCPGRRRPAHGPRAVNLSTGQDNQSTGLVVPPPTGAAPGLRGCRDSDHRPGPASAPATERKGVPGRGSSGLGPLFPPAASPERVHPPDALALGAFKSLRQHVVSQLPEDAGQQVDTTALPVKHPSRVRGPDNWHGPGELHAGFGRAAAHGAWFYGFRLALRTGETVHWTVSRARGWSGPGASFRDASTGRVTGGRAGGGRRPAGGPTDSPPDCSSPAAGGGTAGLRARPG